MQQQLKTMPIGRQDFASLRQDGCAYIDKTRFVYQLVNSGKYYFLSRPRRFGKSLLLSTFKAYFEGRREVFDGLDIAQLEQDWTARPVLHLDLNAESYTKAEELQKRLNLFLSQQESRYGSDPNEDSLGARFEGVIRRAAEKTGHRVAVLVDEYDKPLLEAIGNEELQEAYRATLKGFYGVLKSMDAYIKFAFLTGVTKFGRVSIFSGLNNIKDISMDARYHDICGITEQELLSYFAPEVEALAEACGMTHDQCVARLRENYDGYRFHPKGQGIYNPFSVLNTLDEGEFGSYWFETGTPSYLVTLLQNRGYNLQQIASSKVTAEVLNSKDLASTNPIPVIYQSGYLTIKDYSERFGTYTLGFPNREVEEGFVKYLLPFYADKPDKQSPFDISNFVEDLEAGNTNQFVERLRTLFADTPYELVKDLENHYQNLAWLLFKLLGYYTQAEYHTSQGRIDLVVKTPKYCYVVEFKLNGTAEEALRQISDRGYTLPFALDGQQIVRIGISFDQESRNIDQYLIG